MKVEGNAVLDCFKQVKLLLAGIADIMRCGDEGFEEAVLSQSEDIKLVLNNFVIDNLTAKGPTQKQHRFLADYAKNNERTESFIDSQNLVKAKIYLHLKRELPSIGIPITMPENEAHNFIYNELILGKDFEFWFYDKLLSSSAYVALNLVVKEHYEWRRKYPQLTMDLSAPKEEPEVKNWFDNIKTENCDLPDFFK